MVLMITPIVSLQGAGFLLCVLWSRADGTQNVFLFIYRHKLRAVGRIDA